MAPRGFTRGVMIDDDYDDETSVIIWDRFPPKKREKYGRLTRTSALQRLSKKYGLIILLALLVGVLYSLHLLVKDYQALTASRLLRFLFKRDVTSQHHPKPSVRWKRILLYDPIQCARYVYCDLGARPANNDVRRGFAFMLTLEPQDEDKPAWEVFKQAYQLGSTLKSKVQNCHHEYPKCPFQAPLLFKLIEYLIKNDI